MFEKFNNLTLFLKVIIFLETIIILVQLSFALLFFTPLKLSVQPIMTNSLGSYNESSVFGLLSSALLITIIILGIINKKHWAVLLQEFILLPMFFVFPIGTMSFVFIIYKLVKLEQSNYFT